MTTTPTPSLKIKLRLGGLGSSQPSVSSSSSFLGTAPISSSGETIAAATPTSVSFQTSVRTSSTSIPATPLNQDEGNGNASGTVVKKRRRRKNAKAETGGENKKSRSTSGEGKARINQGTPSDSRQGTPVDPTRANIAMDLFKNKNMRPRKWRRASMMITTVGGEMEVPVWRTDDQPRIASLPNSNGSNSDGGNAIFAPPVPVPIVKPPFDPARPCACPEPNCIKAFPSEDKLASHTIAVHGPKIHGCDMCWKRFGKKEQLARHRKTHLIHVVTSSSSAYEKARRTNQDEREDGDEDDSEEDEADEADS